jgi:Domain of unknown function (DUF4350)
VRTKLSADAGLVFGILLVVMAVIVAGAFVAPAREDRDPTPSTENNGSAGAKGTYLLLSRLGYHVDRWDQPVKALSTTSAAHTTLILADARMSDIREEVTALTTFLNHGGRVVATGPISALMVPDAHIGAPSHFYTALCYTTPQGLSALARAGRVAMPVTVRWNSDAPSLRVDQSCGDDAVVVHYPVGQGEVIWWSSSAPLSNRGLRNGANLKLLLASIGEPGRIVLFDEYIHGGRQDLWDTARGTPAAAMGWQLAAVALLVVASFGRRSGPLRGLVQVPRTSPLEFAESMGDLYRKADAVSVATGCAERRLMHFLEYEGGIPRETLRRSPEEIAQAVSQRFLYRDAALAMDLKAAREAEFNKLSAKSALGLIRRMDQHMAKLAALMRHSQTARQDQATQRSSKTGSSNMGSGNKGQGEARD